ncbi:MAG TPA: gliding motility protein GldL [Bacteroidia bacterium]|nr:gliding motility protein GldL [Bacteroidia bacterium]
MGLVQMTQGKNFKTFMARLYGWGASVVILGALFKIQHYPGAGIMLILGLGTEATIFFFSGFEPPHEEVDWSLVYPELAGMQDDDEKKKARAKDPVAMALDKILEDGKIGTDLILSLGNGMRNLSENAVKLSDLTDASVATNEYVTNVREASNSVNDMAKSYGRAAEAAEKIALSSEDIKVYNDQVSAVGKNLAALNAVYELQLQDSNEHLKQTSKFYEGINDLMSNLNSSLEGTKQYKDEVAILAKNLSALNTIYGNMLSAMNVNR